MRRWKLALAGTLVAVASFNALACYTVYDRSGRVVYNASESPVDMSRPLHETMPQRFPGGHMVFDTVTSCPSIVQTPTGRMARSYETLGSPLLTDASTAQKMHVQHTVVADGIALVAPQQVAMRPQVTVIPSETTLALARANANRDTTVITEARDGSVLDTRVMGAGPAPRR